MFNDRWKTGVLGKVLATAIVCLFSASCDETSTTRSDVTTPPGPSTPPPPISPASQDETWLVTGTAIPEADSMVAASGQGVVRIIHVARGQAVRRGEPLVTLDVRAASLSVRAARSRLDSLRTQSEQMTHECTRAERLAASGALPEAERARQAANCAAQVGQISAVEAEVALASTRVQDGAIRAPFDGVVVEVLVEVGEFVAPPQPVLRLVDVDPLHVEVRVPAQHAADLQIGQRAWVSSSIDGERSGATVAFLSPTLQFDSRERVADLVLSTPSPFLAGAFVVVRFDPNPLATAEGGH